MTHIGQIIKERRMELGLSQAELAKKVGYAHRTAISKIELERDIPIKKLVPIAKALDLDVKQLLLDYDSASSQEERLLEYYKRLTPQGKDMLLDMAKMLDEHRQTPLG